MSSRPWRLKNATTQEDLRWRCYATLEAARWGVLRAMKYECPVGQTLEVYNKDTGHERGQYKRLLDGVKVMNDPSWKGKK
jgi:hypothetical protein